MGSTRPALRRGAEPYALGIRGIGRIARIFKGSAALNFPTVVEWTDFGHIVRAGHSGQGTPGDSLMTFHLSQADIDLVSGQATVSGTEPAPPGPPPPGSPPAAALPKTVQVRFAFTPPAVESQELSLMVKQAKLLLQQAANDL